MPLATCRSLVRWPQRWLPPSERVALMAIPNLLSLLFLNGVIVHETRKYLWRGRLDKEM